MLANIGAELLAMTGIINIVTAVASCFVTVQIGKYWLVLVLLVLASMLPYIKLTGLRGTPFRRTAA